MPTYEYQCSKCSHRFEQIQSITAKPGAVCEKCGKKARRLISSGAGLLFKGSGFYITDYRSSQYKQSAKADSSGTGSSDSTKGKESASSEKKPPPAEK